MKRSEAIEIIYCVDDNISYSTAEMILEALEQYGVKLPPYEANLSPPASLRPKDSS